MFWNPTNRLDSISSIRNALLFLLGKRFLKRFSHIDDGFLIKAVAENIGRNPARLLLNVAYLNGLEAKNELTEPSSDLINQIGYSLDCLKTHRILPQPYKDRFSIVIADPTTINVDEWMSFGIPIYLSFGQLIDDTYNRFYSVDFSLKKAIEELATIVLEAQKSGANEVCIGTLNDSFCEYSIGEESITKEINSSIYRSLLSYLNIATKITLTLPSLENKKISVTRLQNGARAILYLHWDFEEPLNNKVKAEWTDQSIQDLILKTALNAMPIPYSLQ